MFTVAALDDAWAQHITIRTSSTEMTVVVEPVLPRAEVDRVPRRPALASPVDSGGDQVRVVGQRCARAGRCDPQRPGDHLGRFTAKGIAAAAPDSPGSVSVVSGLDRATCLAVLEASVPGSVARAVKDADTFFGIALPSLGEWVFGREQAAAIHCPVLSVRGTDTLPLFVEVADFVRSSIPHVTESTIDDIGHLLHIQRPRPVARAMAQFLGSNCIAGN